MEERPNLNLVANFGYESTWTFLKNRRPLKNRPNVRIMSWVDWAWGSFEGLEWERP